MTTTEIQIERGERHRAVDAAAAVIVASDRVYELASSGKLVRDNGRGIVRDKAGNIVRDMSEEIVPVDAIWLRDYLSRHIRFLKTAVQSIHRVGWWKRSSPAVAN